jgi:hypothetical protein
MLAGLATCMDVIGGEGGRRPAQKAKMEIDLRKSENFDAIMAAEKDKEAAAAEANGYEEDAEDI